ncbi:MAG: hypothetical protein ACRDJC_01650 [Thermomicrobiales bacterium]
MALSNPQITNQPWRTPVWPEKLPAAEFLRARYGPDADELTIRFPETAKRDIVVVWLATPKVEYAALMVHEHTGEVVGVQVDYLADYARMQHVAWQAAATSNPPLAVASRIVTDIKQLFDRYGIEPSDRER